MDQAQGFKLPPWLQMGAQGGAGGMPQGLPPLPQGFQMPQGLPPTPPAGGAPMTAGAPNIDVEGIRRQMAATHGGPQMQETGGPPQGAQRMPPWLQGMGQGGPPQMPPMPQGMPQLPPGFKMPPGFPGAG